jgi:hypothetical protein
MICFGTPPRSSVVPQAARFAGVAPVCVHGEMADAPTGVTEIRDRLDEGGRHVLHVDEHGDPLRLHSWLPAAPER